nr:hypothetical protein CFP56_30129 [Quercus suber]
MGRRGDFSRAGCAPDMGGVGRALRALTADTCCCQSLLRAGGERGRVAAACSWLLWSEAADARRGRGQARGEHISRRDESSGNLGDVC